MKEGRRGEGGGKEGQRKRGKGGRDKRRSEVQKVGGGCTCRE